MLIQRPDQTKIPSSHATIGFALARSRLRPNLRSGGHTAIEVCLVTAAEVVAHLTLCGWRLARKPPAELHSTPGPPAEDRPPAARPRDRPPPLAQPAKPRRE
ncbi:MAG: hypothetical protein WC807_10900 [Hyphomicrobium sp.]